MAYRDPYAGTQFAGSLEAVKGSQGKEGSSSLGAPKGTAGANQEQQYSQYQDDRTGLKADSAAAKARNLQQQGQLDLQQQQQQQLQGTANTATNQAAANAAGQAAPGQDVFSQKLAGMANGQFSPDDPSYQWRLKQGQQAVERSAAAKGQLGSGNVLTALTDYGQGAASQEYSAQFSRMLQGSQNATSQYSAAYGALGSMLGASTSVGQLGSDLIGRGVSQGSLAAQQQGVDQATAGLGINEGELGVNQNRVAIQAQQAQWGQQNTEWEQKNRLASQQQGFIGQIGESQGTYGQQQSAAASSAAAAKSAGYDAAVAGGFGGNYSLGSSSEGGYMGKDGWQTGTSWDGSGGSGGSSGSEGSGGSGGGWSSSTKGFDWGSSIGNFGVPEGISSGGDGGGGGE
jgi:hypothetical protein